MKLTALRGFLGKLQLSTLRYAIRDDQEENQFFREKAVELAGVVRAMPETYGQDGKGDQAVAHLHYFTAGCDWFITEKDKGSADDEPEQFQSQAFGLCCIHEAELGYVSLPELLAAGAELDFHWTPETLGNML